MSRDNDKQENAGREGAAPESAAPESAQSTHWQVAEARLVQLCARAMERTSWAGCRRTGSWLGLAFYYGVVGRQRTAIKNLRIAFPYISESAARRYARRAVQNLGMTFCESLHLAVASKEDVRDYVTTEGLEYLQEAYADGKGAILLSAHFGNWELSGARVAQELPLSVMARPNSNAGVESHVEQVRRAAGIKVISKWDSARPSLRVLRSSEILVVLPDQRAGKGEGLLLPMFGRVTRFYSSVAQLAYLSGAPVVPGFGVRREPWLSDGRIIAQFAPPLQLKQDAERRGLSREEAVREGTQRVIGELEKIIRAHPDQWWWLHRRWREADAKRELQDKLKSDPAPLTPTV
ncbi:MAG TPA: lysophospholipid acyltransferase family protein [Abditibacteriaceae bacterium]|jgi:KDO2-lipid IV(A) lauroyltransferase